MPEYKIIGNTFNVGRVLVRAYSGPIIASRDAYYLVIQGCPGGSGGSSGGGIIGGAIGGFIGAAIGGAIGSLFASGPKPEVPEVMETDLSELPKEITGHPDWPIKEMKAGRVIVVPREAVKNVRYLKIVGTYCLETEVQKFRIGLTFRGRREVISFLRDMSWEF